MGKKAQFSVILKYEEKRKHEKHVLEKTMSIALILFLVFFAVACVLLFRFLDRFWRRRKVYSFIELMRQCHPLVYEAARKAKIPGQFLPGSKPWPVNHNNNP